MPEGDTIFRLAEDLRPALVGRVVEHLELPRSPISALAAGDRAFMVGQRIERVEARGKNLLIHFENGWLLHTHLRMNGRWRLFDRADPRSKWRAGASVVLEVEGLVALCRDAPVARLLRPGSLDRDRDIRGLGPDLCSEDFDIDEALRRLVRCKATPLGVAIMDQRVLAGIGNVYKSELCFNQKLDPRAPITAFEPAELQRLVLHAREVLMANIAPRGPRSRYRKHERVTRATTRSNGPTQSVYRRVGQPCFDCGTPIEMTRQGQLLRSTYFCPTCQPRRA